jgi:transcriptional regulator with XRE-family HTH domain
MTTPEALAREVKAELLRKGITQRQLAQALDTPYRTLNHKLNGRTELRFGDLARIATELGVRTSDLIARAEANKDSAA